MDAPMNQPSKAPDDWKPARIKARDWAFALALRIPLQSGPYAGRSAGCAFSSDEGLQLLEHMARDECLNASGFQDDRLVAQTLIAHPEAQVRLTGLRAAAHAEMDRIVAEDQREREAKEAI